MKSLFTKFALVGTFALATIFSSGVAAKAISVEKTFKYDYNTVLGYNTNYHGYEYIWVPNNAYYSSQSVNQIGGSWNYARYRVIKYYKSGGSIY